MSNKRRITVSVNEELVDYLDGRYPNRSEKIESLIRKDREYGGQSRAAVLDLRLEQLRSEREQAQATVERVENEMDRIRERVAATEGTHEDALRAAFERCGDIPPDPENPGIRTQAGNVGLTPTEFAEQLDAYQRGEWEPPNRGGDEQ